jgi:hypothetical protein
MSGISARARAMISCGVRPGSGAGTSMTRPAALSGMATPYSDDHITFRDWWAAWPRISPVAASRITAPFPSASLALPHGGSRPAEETDFDTVVAKAAVTQQAHHTTTEAAFLARHAPARSRSQ